MSYWDQFVTMLFGHLAKAKSLREIIGGMASQESFLYHLGAKLMKRSSLSYANAHRPWKIYRDVFYQFLTQCRFFQTGQKFRFKNKLLSIDATVIELTGDYSYQGCPYPVRRIEVVALRPGK
jgi:hypothetical protein